MSTFLSSFTQTWLHRLLPALLLLALLAPAMAQAGCGSGPIETSPNRRIFYILGSGATDGMAMHWASGLVWKRCSEGQSWNGTTCTGMTTAKPWNDWMVDYMPKPFADLGHWWTPSGGYTPPAMPDLATVPNRLRTGAWRLPYTKELHQLTIDCSVGPAINSVVFPDTSTSFFWSGSPNTGSSDYAWRVYIYRGSVYFNRRYLSYCVRLVRGGQWFDPLTSPPAQTVPANSVETYAPITVQASDASPGNTAWGGARISGQGNPEFQVNNSGNWVTEAIVKSGDTIQVRLTAGAAPSVHTATLALRSGQTQGTLDDGSNGGDEATTMAETTAEFTVNVLDVFDLNYTAGPGGTLTGDVSQTVTEGSDGTPVTAVPDAHYHFTAWDDGVSTATRTDTNVQADLNVTALFTIDTYTVTFVDWDGTTLDTQTVNYGSAAAAPPDPTRTGYTFTGWDVPFNNITSDLTVTALYSISQYTVTASVAGGHGSVSPTSLTVNHGDAASFTVSPDAGYHPAMPAAGTCPAGSLSGNQYSTGAVTADCTVALYFDQNAPGGLQVQGGDGQQASVLQPFADALEVRVTDAAGAPLESITVNFSAPTTGASAVLSDASVLTDAGGIALVTASANAIAGSYTVQASLGGTTPVLFTLENTALVSTLQLTASPTTVQPGQTVTLIATVSSSGSLTPGGTVDFLVDGVVVCDDVPVDANGVATCTAGPFGPGTHSVSANYSGDASHAASSANISFTAAAPLPVPGNQPWALLLLLLATLGTGGWFARKRAL